MKLWVDGVRPAPEGYIWVKGVNDAISWIKASVRNVGRAAVEARSRLIDRGYQDRSACYERADRWTIELIDMGYEAGDSCKDDRDYIRILYWLEEMELRYPIRVHSLDLDSAARMRQVIRRNRWKEIY